MGGGGAAASVSAAMDGYAVPGHRHGHDAATDVDVPAALYALCSPSLPAAAAASSLLPPPPPPQTGRGLLRRDQDRLARRPPPLDGRELPPQLLCSHRRGTLQILILFQ